MTNDPKTPDALIVGRLLADPDRPAEPGWLTIRDGFIDNLGHGPPPAEVADLPRLGGRTRVISPAFTDAHTHLPQVDSVEALYEAPQSQFVADFIGDVNTVDARVVSASDDGLTIETGGTERFIPAANGFAGGDRIHVCVRPHDVSLSGDGDFATDGTVRTRSYQGSDTVYTVETDQWGDIVADVRGSSFDVGDSVTVAWNAADVHLFAAGEEGTVEGAA